ncbi:unnamed protein product [Gongylonema pulchrum]|uniref:ShKT domain-containing protein n=1 Tax=Gongylonema pulchrum TaxID=637853 RepID=A0A183DQ45_9BILA|nr:unnamed protein product [Gongylonema pulchrum]
MTRLNFLSELEGSMCNMCPEMPPDVIPEVACATETDENDVDLGTTCQPLPELCVAELRQSYGGLANMSIGTMGNGSGTAATPNRIKPLTRMQQLETQQAILSPPNLSNLPEIFAVTVTAPPKLAGVLRPLQDKTVNVTVGAPSLSATATLPFTSWEYSEESAENQIDDFETATFTGEQQEHPDVTTEHKNVFNAVMVDDKHPSSEQSSFSTPDLQTVENPRILDNVNRIKTGDHRLVSVERQVLTAAKQRGTSPHIPVQTTPASQHHPTSVTDFHLVEKSMMLGEYDTEVTVSGVHFNANSRTTVTISPSKGFFSTATTAPPFQLGQMMFSNDFTTNPSITTRKTNTNTIPSITRASSTAHPYSGLFLKVPLFRQKLVSETGLQLTSTTATNGITIAEPMTTITTTAPAPTAALRTTPPQTKTATTPTPATTTLTPATTRKLPIPLKTAAPRTSLAVPATTVSFTTLATLAASSLATSPATATVRLPALKIPPSAATVATKTTASDTISSPRDTVTSIASTTGKQLVDARPAHFFSSSSGTETPQNRPTTISSASTNETVPQMMIYFRDSQGRLRLLAPEISESAAPFSNSSMTRPENTGSFSGVLEQAAANSAKEQLLTSNTSAYVAVSGAATSTVAQTTEDESQLYEQLNTSESAYRPLVLGLPDDEQDARATVSNGTRPINYIDTQMPAIPSASLPRVDTRPLPNNSVLLGTAVPFKEEPPIASLLLFSGYEPSAIEAPQPYGQVVSAVERTYSHIIAVAPQAYLHLKPVDGVQGMHSLEAQQQAHEGTVAGAGYGQGLVTNTDQFRNTDESPIPLAFSTQRPLLATGEQHVSGEAQSSSKHRAKEDTVQDKHVSKTDPGSPACDDKHELCCFWATVGECDSNPYWMRIQCAKTCVREAKRCVSTGIRCYLAPASATTVNQFPTISSTRYSDRRGNSVVYAFPKATTFIATATFPEFTQLPEIQISPTLQYHNEESHEVQSQPFIAQASYEAPKRAPRRTTEMPHMTTPVAASAVSETCYDHNRHCKFWADLGECERNPFWMRSN